jgi:hypothetical protein
MSLLPITSPASWYEPGRFSSRDRMALVQPFAGALAVGSVDSMMSWPRRPCAAEGIRPRAKPRALGGSFQLMPDRRAAIGPSPWRRRCRGISGLGGHCHSTVALHPLRCQWESGLMAVICPGRLSVASRWRMWFREAAVERDVGGAVSAVVQLHDLVGPELFESRADRGSRAVDAKIRRRGRDTTVNKALSFDCRSTSARISAAGSW